MKIKGKVIRQFFSKIAYWMKNKKIDENLKMDEK